MIGPLALVAATLLAASPAPPAGKEVMRRVNERPRGGDATMRLRLDLDDAERGSFSKDVEVSRVALASGHRTLYHITAPEHEKGIVLLVAEDEALGGLWMYFPRSDHLLKVASRGLSALASDFSCEDLKLAFALDDYTFTNLGRDRWRDHDVWKVEMVPATTRLARELGFARAVGWVRDDIWMIVRSDYFDSRGELFKTFEVEALEQVQGVWTATRTAMVNHRVNHRTDVEVLEVRYGLHLDEAVHRPQRLAAVSRGEEAAP